jgi:hypothetical protein
METKQITAVAPDSTPGPWEVVQELGARLFTILSRYRKVASVDDPADARLIAAAPDMLAALESIANSGLAKDSADARFLCGIARAAIAKARGA